MPRPSDMIPVEWLAFFDEMYKWANVPPEQILHILVEANLSYLQLETLCDIINDNLEHQDEIPEKFERFLRQLGDIICGYDPISNYFWETKTKHDFSPFEDLRDALPTESDDWKQEYVRTLKMLEKKLVDAVEAEDWDGVIMLMELGADPSAEDNLAIRYASVHDFPEVVKMLLEDPRVDPSAENNDAILFASMHGYSEVVKMLLEDPRVNPSANNNFAISWASRNGHAEVVRMLLEDPRVNPSAKDNEALRWASAYGYAEIVKLLLEDPRVDPSARGNEALRWASSRGHAEVVELLLADPRVDATKLETVKY